MSDEGPQAVQTAIRMEQEGLQMYEQVAAKTSHPFGKKMFLSLADDERAHIRMIETIARGLGLEAVLKEARSGTPRERIVTIFSEVKDEVVERLAATHDELDALKLAMAFEKKGYEFYRRVAAEATEADAKTLYGRLADEETQHYEVLQNTLDYLERTKHWFTWEEKALLDGGA